MANKPKTDRDGPTIIATGVAKLHGEASVITGDSYSKLARLVKENRLKSFGIPIKVEVPHLIEQWRNDYPLLEDSA